MGSSAAAYQDGGAKEFQIQKRADVLSKPRDLLGLLAIEGGRNSL